MIWVWLNAIIFMIIMGLVVSAHEFGHLFYMNHRLNKRVRVRFTKGYLLVGESKDYLGHTPRQYVGIYGYGIIFGFTPFILTYNVLPPFYLYMGIGAYLIGCYADIFNVVRYGLMRRKWK